MLKSLNRAVVPGPFSMSCFQVSDQIKEYLVKANRPVIISHHQLKKRPEIKDRVWITYQNGKVKYHGQCSMLLEPQCHGLTDNFWNF